MNRLLNRAALLGGLCALAARAEAGEESSSTGPLLPWTGAAVEASYGDINLSGSWYQSTPSGVWTLVRARVPVDGVSLLTGAEVTSPLEVGASVEVGWDSIHRRLLPLSEIVELENLDPEFASLSELDQTLAIGRMVALFCDELGLVTPESPGCTDTDVQEAIATRSDDDLAAVLQSLRAILDSEGVRGSSDPQVLAQQQSILESWAKNLVYFRHRLSPDEALGFHWAVSGELSGTYAFAEAFPSSTEATPDGALTGFADYDLYVGALGRFYWPRVYAVGRVGYLLRQSVDTTTITACNAAAFCNDVPVLAEDVARFGTPLVQGAVGVWNDSSLFNSGFVPGVEVRARGYSERIASVRDTRLDARASIFLGENSTVYGLRTGFGGEWTFALSDGANHTAGDVLSFSPMVFLSGSFDRPQKAYDTFWDVDDDPDATMEAFAARMMKAMQEGEASGPSEGASSPSEGAGGTPDASSTPEDAGGSPEDPPEPSETEGGPTLPGGPEPSETEGGPTLPGGPEMGSPPGRPNLDDTESN